MRHFLVLSTLGALALSLYAFVLTVVGAQTWAWLKTSGALKQFLALWMLGILVLPSPSYAAEAGRLPPAAYVLLPWAIVFELGPVWQAACDEVGGEWRPHPNFPNTECVVDLGLILGENQAPRAKAPAPDWVSNALAKLP